MPVRPTCPFCGATLSAGARYCDRCGTPLNHPAGTTPPRRRIRKEHRVAVWLFLVVVALVFSAGTVGGYRFRAGAWPGLPAVQRPGNSLPLSGSKVPQITGESPQAIAGYLRSVVAITAKDQTGSGFMIDDRGHVVTAHHVVENTSCVTVWDDNGRQHQGTVLSYDPVSDVALLHVAGLEKWPDYLEMAAESPPAQVGDGTYVIGHSRGAGSIIPTSATVTKLSSDQTAGGRYHKGLLEVSDVTVPKGTSGGPLVSKRTGKVIGVMVLSGDPTAVAWARPVSDIANLVEQWSALRPSTTCEFTPPTRTIPLTLVTITPRTGAYGVEGEELADGAELALRDMESALRSVGYEVTLKREDDAGSPTRARDRAELVAQDPKVIGVVGSLETQTTHAIAEALYSTGLPVVAPTAGADDLTARGWPHFNRVVASSLRQNPVLAGFAKDLLKVNNVFVLEDGSVDAAAQVESFTDGAGVIGLPVSGTMTVSPSTDAAEVIRRLAEAQAEAVYYAGRSDVALRLVRTLRAQEVMLPFLGNQAAFAPTQFQPYVEFGAQGIYFTRLTAEPVGQFRRKYESVFGKPTRGYAAYGYDAAYVILDALARYGETHAVQAPARQDLARMVRQTRGYGGWSAPITFTGNGENQTSWVHVYEWNRGLPVYQVNL
ncbi:MAG TPA: ABC transporter substrate-binding protein [Symbiobacteriaceae bacterium]|nr:ABC transporter substrate-binding protein [Symbiobacteriaceae bacterium]